MADREQLILEMQTQGGAQANAPVRQLAQNTQDVGETAQKAKDKFKEMALKIVGLSAVAGAAIGGIGRNLDLQDAGAKLQAQLGLDDSSTKQIAKDVGSVYAQNFGDSFDEVGDAMRSAIQNGFADVDDGSNIAAAKAILGIKQAFGAESDEVSRTVGGLIKNGLVDSSGDAFDLITRGFQKGADKGGEFLDSLNEYGVQFKALGFDAKDFTNILVTGNKNGAFSIDKVGDAIKEFSVRAVDGSTTTAAGFKAIGMDATKTGEAIAGGGPLAKKTFQDVVKHIASMKDPLKQQQAGVALFGTQWEDIRGKAITALAGTNNAIGKTKGATDQMNKALGSTMRARWESLKRVAAATFSTALINGIMAVVDGVKSMVDWVGRVVKRFKEGHTVTVIAVVAFGTLATAVTIAGTALAIMAAKQALWTKATKVAAVVQQIWNKSILSSPITWLVVGLVAIGVAIWQLYQRNEKFRVAVQHAWASIKGAVGSVVAWVKPKFADFKSAMASVFNWLAPKVAFVFGIVKKEIQLGVSVVKWYITAWKNVLTFLASLPGRVTSAISGLWDGLKDGFKSAVNWIITKWNDLSFHIGGTDLGPFGHLPSATLNTPNIPLLYTGGEIQRGGMAIVGDRGPELVKLPTGSTVYDSQQSSMAMRGMGSTRSRATVEFKGGTHEMRLLAKSLIRAIDIETAHG